MNRIILITFFLLLFSCYEVNDKTSRVIELSWNISKDNWDTIYLNHKIMDTSDISTKIIINDFKQQPFINKVIYFDEFPEEYYGIDENNSSVRYIYNKNISNKVLDGLSPELKDSEKIRIALRMNALLFNYMDEESQINTIRRIKNQCDYFLNSIPNRLDR